MKITERVNFVRIFLTLGVVSGSLIGTGVRGATLLVYNNNDSGAGSLRQAIATAHLVPGPNTIVFSNVVTGIIGLTAGEILISSNMTILGPGPSLVTVGGNGASRLFHIVNAATVNISGLTITAGRALGAFPLSEGGGIYNVLSTLTVSNCVFTSNFADGSGGGINNAGGTLTVADTTFSANLANSSGGGIYNDGSVGGNATLFLSGSTFNSNQSQAGGGIFNDPSGTMWVAKSTFYNNSGSGIYITSAYMNFVTGCTLSDNTPLDIFHGPGTLQINSTILKAAAGGGTIQSGPGTVSSLGFNLSSDFGGGYLTAVGDQVNTDPKLGPLQDNGGPTWTMMPLAGSPAIDKGFSQFLTTEQRGRPRIYDYPAIANAASGDGSDIGAVEVFPATLIVSNANDSGAGSLRQAIADVSAGDFITFAPNVTGQITLTSGQLAISNHLTILGPGPDVLAVSGNNSNRVFYINHRTVSISGLTVRNGSVLDDGGGINNNSRSTLTLSNCTLTGNSAVGALGGGIFNDTSTLIIRNCTLSSNTASGGSGGALANSAVGDSATSTVMGCTLSGNSSSFGGGIYNFGSSSGTATLTITNSTLSGNSTGKGGGIYNFGSSSGTANLTLIASTISSNSSSSSGGGIVNRTASGVAHIEMGNTILKTGPSGENISSSGGTLTSDGYNLSSDNGGGVLTNATDQINTDPRLGPLQNNGGPTFTHALLSSSPAIDRGRSFGVSTDQRGAPRPYDFSATANASGGDGSDIGAFELGPPTLNIQKSASNAILSWQSYCDNFTLQSVTNVIASNSWVAVAGTPVVVANQYVLTNGPISGNKFYRLKGN